ncbi:Sec-independent protein translocase subunit TatA [Gordonia sp. L191]|uniref:Sec-independent protein translocase subunit TatA n=1 Tax=Gordonia TaxID=2053 RepID=UPI001AD67A21|nr:MULTISPECIES: Sec-independent protein translocase subunit TatA [Gordonia]QTI67166.1 Sec-independent protein translocase subunit TatA [Gordonia polyisoprenivorans]WHU49470.1 Sec-independent protein translocase subunit TatA [Gordonia sp. L191]
MGAMSWWHWVIVLVVLVLLFGSKKLPDAARGLGQSLRIFKSEVQEMQKDGETRPTAAEPAPPRELPTSPETPAHNAAAPNAPADNTKKSA